MPIYIYCLQIVYMNTKKKAYSFLFLY